MQGFPVLSRFERLTYCRYVEEFMNIGLPVVSVGSGEAILEEWMTNFRPATTLHCVDPEPESYAIGKPRIIPEAESVAKLIEKLPDLVDNCAVVIIRPSPTVPRARMIGYDVESVVLLRPRVILVLYCADGGDGSDELHKFLEENGCPSISLFPRRETNIVLPRYYSRSIKFTLRVAPPTMIQVSTCSLLIREDAGIVFPVDMPEDEQNPEALNDEHVQELLSHSIFGGCPMQ